MPAAPDPSAVFKEYPEPDFPSDQARDAYRAAKEEIRNAWQQMQKGKKVTILDLSRKGLTALPPEIGQLTTLTELYLHNNHLTALPPEIGRLSALTALDLMDNHLTALPPEISQLAALKQLICDNSSLRRVPERLRACRALEKLALVNCELESLPTWLRSMPNLIHLRVAGNPRLGLPAEVVGAVGVGWGEPDAIQVLDFYFSLQEQGEQRLNEVKLLLVGRGEAGKTSVSRALRGEDFTKEQKETPGIEIKAWKLECPGEEAVKVHVWDFAGQEITHETHRFFLTERSLYLVVLDGRGGQQMEEAEYWLSHVEKFGTRRAQVRHGRFFRGELLPHYEIERSPVIVVLNKWDSPGPYDVEQRRLQREYPNIVAFVRTDCATALGIAELKDTICAALGKMPGVWHGWPRSYKLVREALDALVTDADPGKRRPFVNWERFREVCAGCGVTEVDRQQSLAENLNALGVALYYGDDERLRDTRVLNPNWAANGLYGIVRGVNKAPWQGKRGHLWEGEFAAVLAEGMAGMDPVRGAVIEDYPEERDGVKVHEFLLQLMVDRELGFQTGTWKGRPLYLLPGLLTLDEPEPKDFDVAAHMDRAELRFRYLYELLPAGVMSRFIVRTHTLSDGQHRWQRGVVLAWGGAKALVMAERRRNPRMDVYILGGTPAERQELAGVVRSNMDAIHAGLPDGLRGKEELDLTVPGTNYESVDKLEQLEREGKQVQVVTPRGTVETPPEKELEQVQPAKARRRGAPKLRVFVSYARLNYKMWDKLKTHLDILKNERLIQWWFDGKIRPGSEWDDAIRKELKEADVVILLLSNEFFASKYIKGVELKEARNRHRTGEAVILPVLLEQSPAFEKQTWLKTLQTVPVVKGQLRPLNGFNPSVTGWNEVQKALREVIAEIANRRGERNG